MKIFEYIFAFLVFPGFLFSSCMGLVVGWIDRKVTARLQWRVGPPWYQNFVDVAKFLFYKETTAPQGAPKAIFFGMPVLAAISTALLSTLVLMSSGAPQGGFPGDLILIVFLFAIPSIALEIGGSVSRNPLGSLGAHRERSLMFAYEVPFVLSLLVPVIKAGCAIRLGDILSYQAAGTSIIKSPSGILSFLVMFLCFQAKLGFAPFDIAEAETEISSGPYIEYSGKALALFKLARAMMTFVAPVFLITLYFGGLKLDPAGLAKGILQYLSIIVVMILIKNTNPRVRLDQARRFFLVGLTIIAILSVASAYMGF